MTARDLGAVSAAWGKAAQLTSYRDATPADQRRHARAWWHLTRALERQHHAYEREQAALYPASRPRPYQRLSWRPVWPGPGPAPWVAALGTGGAT